MRAVRAARHDTVAVPPQHPGDASRAMRDALRAIARDIPDPAKYANWAPLWIVEALMRAHLFVGRHGNEWRAAGQDADALKPYGLVEAGRGRRGLTAFAIKVRRELKRDDA